MDGFLSKAKSFFKKHRKQIIDLAATAILLAAISLITFFVLLASNVIYFDDGMKFNISLFRSFSSSWYGSILFVLLHMSLSILLCVIPGASMAFILLSQAVYPEPWRAFLLSFISVMITSSAMYIVGKFGGYKLCSKILGEDDCKKALGLLRDKGTVFFPLMMMFPIFPDDALVMIAGTIKMRPSWFIPSIVIGRGIGIATITFGLSIIPFDKFTTPWHWLGFIAACAVSVVIVFTLAIKLNKYIEKKHASAEHENAEEEKAQNESVNS